MMHKCGKWASNLPVIFDQTHKVGMVALLLHRIVYYLFQVFKLDKILLDVDFEGTILGQ